MICVVQLVFRLERLLPGEIDAPFVRYIVLQRGIRDFTPVKIVNKVVESLNRDANYMKMLLLTATFGVTDNHIRLLQVKTCLKPLLQLTKVIRSCNLKRRKHLWVWV